MLCCAVRKAALQERETFAEIFAVLILYAYDFATVFLPLSHSHMRTYARSQFTREAHSLTAQAIYSIECFNRSAERVQITNDRMGYEPFTVKPQITMKLPFSVRACGVVETIRSSISAHKLRR
jgi:hypothetical protein